MPQNTEMIYVLPGSPRDILGLIDAADSRRWGLF